MFLLNLGYTWEMLSTIENLNGCVILPSNNYSDRVLKASTFDINYKLLDPQLYLCHLDSQECQTTCSRLSSYPWFSTKDMPSIESEKQSSTEWHKKIKDNIDNIWTNKLPDNMKTSIKKSIEFQIDINCSHILIPTPLISNREDEFNSQCKWIDEGLIQIRELEVGKPTLISISIDENILNDECFEDTGFLNTVVDQVTARKDIDGIYLVVLQNDDKHPYKSSKNVFKTYLYLSKMFSNNNYEDIIINYSDVFGLVCLYFGATSIATGPSFKLRRMSTNQYKDGGGGVSLPLFYSSKTLSEYYSERDLNKIVEKKLLLRIKDITPFSRELYNELKSGGSAANLPDWVESRSNTAASKKHFIFRIKKEFEIINNLSKEEKKEHIKDLLEIAISNKLFIDNRLKEEKLKGNAAPSSLWLDLFEEFTT